MALCENEQRVWKNYCDNIACISMMLENFYFSGPWYNRFSAIGSGNKCFSTSSMLTPLAMNPNFSSYPIKSTYEISTLIHFLYCSTSISTSESFIVESPILPSMESEMNSSFLLKVSMNSYFSSTNDIFSLMA